MGLFQSLPASPVFFCLNQMIFFTSPDKWAQNSHLGDFLRDMCRMLPLPPARSAGGKSGPLGCQGSLNTSWNWWLPSPCIAQSVTPMLFFQFATPSPLPFSQGW
eukprot:EG_transcript_55880